VKIACYTITYNEELMLPHFIKHYKQFCDKIVVYDNMSTDRTKQIALDNGCEVISWEATGGGLNDNAYIQIKSNCYKQDKDKYDWVIIVDCDEFYSHKNGVDKFLSILHNYKKIGVTLPKIQGFNMVADITLNNVFNLLELNEGVPSISYSKRCIFNPKLNMTWDFGCHPEQSLRYLTDPGIVESTESDIILLHYKFLNLNYVLNRHKSYKERLSEFNKSTGLGIHYTFEKSKIIEEYNSLLNQKEKVL